MASKQGETGTITKKTTDPDKKEFGGFKIEGTKSAAITCETVIARMRKQQKRI